jgi:hypothetical protein
MARYSKPDIGVLRASGFRGIERAHGERVNVHGFIDDARL